MLSLSRSSAGTLVWSLIMVALMPLNGAFLFQSRSLNIHYNKYQLSKESDEGSRWAAGLPRSLAVRGGDGKVQQVASQAELEGILSTSGNALVCVDFTATWCSPCQQIAPAFEQLSQELTDVVFLKVDVDENEETAQKYDVFQMPTFLFLRKGEVVHQFSGANAAVLRQKIEGLLGSEGANPDVDVETAGKEIEGRDVEDAARATEGEAEVLGEGQVHEDAEGDGEARAETGVDGRGRGPSEVLAEEQEEDSGA